MFSKGVMKAFASYRYHMEEENVTLQSNGEIVLQ